MNEESPHKTAKAYLAGCHLHDECLNLSPAFARAKRIGGPCSCAERCAASVRAD